MLLHNRFEVIRPIADGSSGITLLARDLHSENMVVIKRFKHLVSDTQALEKEIQLLREIRHPRIPRFIDAFEAKADFVTRWHIVQEFIEGEDLSKEINARRYTIAEIKEMLLSILELVEFLHSLSPPILHRDIKPANLMRRKKDDAIFLIDFGSASELARGTFGHTINTGTLGYQAPEQIRGEALLASDIYSIGVLAIELFGNTSPRNLLQGMVLTWKPTVKHLQPAYISWLEKMLAENPNHRFSSVKEARIALQTLSTHTPVQKNSPKDIPNGPRLKVREAVVDPVPPPLQTPQPKQNVSIVHLKSQVQQYVILSGLMFFSCSIFALIPLFIALQANTALKNQEYEEVQVKLQSLKKILWILFLLWIIGFVGAFGLNFLLLLFPIY